MKKIHYGWIIVAAAVVVFATNALAIYGFGVFLTPLTEELGWERGALSGAFSMGILVAGLLATVTGRICDRYGSRVLVAIGGVSMAVGFLLMSRITALWQAYLIWGVFFGVGFGATVTPLNVTIPRWFRGKIGLAIAIPAAGFGLGSVIAPLLVQWLLSLSDWRMAFVILAGIRLVLVLPLSGLFIRDPEDKGLRPYGEDAEEASRPTGAALDGFTFTEAVKTGRFWFLSLTHFGFGFCLQLIIVHIVPNAIDSGLSAVVAAGILSIVAGSSVAGNLVSGFVSERLGSMRLLTLCCSVMTLAIVWLIFSGQAWMFYIFAAVFGFFYGGVIPLLTIVPARLFGVMALGSIFGMVMMMGTLGGAIGAPFSGFIFDVTGSYTIAFAVGAGICLMAVVFSLLLLRYRKAPAVRPRAAVEPGS